MSPAPAAAARNINTAAEGEIIKKRLNNSSKIQGKFIDVQGRPSLN